MDIKEALKEFARVLKPGGRTVVVDLCAPQKWRSMPARVFLPFFRLLFCLSERKLEPKEDQPF